MVLGRVVFEPSRRRLTSERGRLSLTSREADLLEFLAAHTGQVISRSQIIDGAWGGVAEVTDAAVVSSVYRLRRKLVEAGATVRIATVPGQGYRLLLDAGVGRGLGAPSQATAMLPRS
jgi:DNA-binding response OmpR family regulator